MRVVADELSADDDRRFAMVVTAQERLIAADLTVRGFATRYRPLSEELLRSSSAIPRNDSWEDEWKQHQTEGSSSPLLID
jgi:hypothetical protein